MSHSRGHHEESEDERYARMLQEEENRSMTNQQARNQQRFSQDMSQLSPQEREDVMLARQMADMDLRQQQQSAYGSTNNNYGEGGDPYGGQSRGPSRLTSDGPGQNSISNLDFDQFSQLFAQNNSTPGQSAYRNQQQPPPQQHYPGSGGGGNAMEAQLDYARRLQEEAFRRMQGNAGSSSPQQPPQQRQTTEEDDLALAMRIQMEESGGGVTAGSSNNHLPASSNHAEQEDEDMKLARFMEESGVSIRDMDGEELANLMKRTTGDLRGGSLPPRTNSSAGQEVGSLYPASSIDETDEDDEDFQPRFGRGRSDPYVARPNNMQHSGSDRSPPHRAAAPPPAQRPPTGIPTGIPSHAPSSPHSGIPAGIPTALGIPGSIPSRSSTILSSIPAAIPPSDRARMPMNDTSASDRRGREVERKPPPATQSGKDFVRRTPAATMSGDAGIISPRRRLLGGTPTRKTPGHSQSAGNLRSMTAAIARHRSGASPPRRAKSGASPIRSRSPHRSRESSPARGGDHNPSHNRTKSLDMDVGFEDLPPGVNLPGANDPPGISLPGDLDAAPAPAKKEKKMGAPKLLKRFFGGGKSSDDKKNAPTPNVADGIPAAIPGPDQAGGPIPYSVAANRSIAQGALRNSGSNSGPKSAAICSACGGRSGKMIAAMDKRFHIECFRCMSCNELIDPTTVFAVAVDPMGEQQPLHRKCYAEFYGAPCAVCRKPIPANEDGSVSFIKHPFFSDEQMCPRHADDPRRRCTGCHRFEPMDEPFADLNDGDRCVCYACVRTVIMNTMDVKPLWLEVLRFFESQLMLPIWQEMRDIPILVVGQDALNENQMKDGASVHGDSSQIMTRGLCLSEHEARMSFTVPSLKYNESSSCFEACGSSHSGFMNFEVDPLQGNKESEVTAILCLSGLPRDLTASVLAHEATHAWIKLHPDYKATRPLPPQVEEGCAQLIAYLFLCDGLEPPKRSSGTGPSDEKLRQYFKFSIETEDNDIYGEGYRKAAAAYATLGVGALLEHVVHFQGFPQL